LGSADLERSDSADAFGWPVLFQDLKYAMPVKEVEDGADAGCAAREHGQPANISH
jgi:hypothetical protein